MDPCTKFWPDRAWGVVDFVPSPGSNFPDFRNTCTINSEKTGAMLIPREDGKVRLYIELGSEQDLRNPSTGRVDLSSTSVDKLLEVCEYCMGFLASLSFRKLDRKDGPTSLHPRSNFA